ncbi:sulfotransferase family protein [Oscillatoria salina]|uniref:sulfotransferase family protein n=1 Tax=Oscillatoria salina TaxID=331517 RepID=UPI001CCBBEA7|nr:sulfotransferase [Oscillatoria salina]MBZ8180601.1 sulfotransferase [Oscillatoria salina IIICB1]
MINLLKSPIVAKNQAGTLPNLIIIGAMKCGTTSLHHYLNSHPQISMSREKELDFFLGKKKWQLGIEWYKSHFVGEAKIYGESSPNYTNYPRWENVPERMYSVIPQAKLIYILRDPVERIISNYIHQYATGKETRSINEALANFEDNSYISRSSYYSQLEQYLKYFPEKNILVITLENLSNQPQLTLEKVGHFLNIEPEFDFSQTTKTLHSSVFKRRKNKWGELLSQTNLFKKIKKMPPEIRYHLEKLIYFPFSEQISRPNLDEKLRARLINYLQKDIERLRKHTGDRFKYWCL